LTLLPGSTLDLNGLHLYYRFLDDQGGSVINGQLISMVPGDADTDGDIDQFDLGAVSYNWQTGSLWTQGNFDGDGDVDQFDLGILLANWTGSGSEPIPEPATLGLLIMGGLVLLKRKR
jgi:hypothetical protein